MASQKDLPGFYFDPEKNRYFPIKGPLPGSKRARPFFSTYSTSGECSGSGRVKRHQVHGARRKELTKSSKLLQSREIDGRLLISKYGLYSFQQEFQKLLVSYPEVWKYHNTTFVSDAALEELRGFVQSSEGLKETNLLAMGGINCSISLYGIKNVLRRHDYGPNYMPTPVWPSSRNIHDGAPGIFSNSVAFTSLSSSISCIRRIGRNAPSTTDNVSSFQHALVTTLGSGVSGGSVYVLNLSEPLNLTENSPGLNRRINNVSSCDCTIWTADTCCHGTKAAIGTNFGVSLINLETGRSSLVYRSRSDVLSQQSDLSGNILLCGVRNGAILALDVRQRQPKCFQVSVRPTSRIHYPHKKQPLRNSNSSNRIRMSSAVCSVVGLQTDEQYFFGSSMDGSIKLFDRRFLSRDVQSYEGHMNSHSHLQLGVNPSEKFLLSGGEDCFVRIWSIKTSELIFEENVSNCIFSTVHWPSYGDFSYGSDEFFKCGENPYKSRCSWGVWLGSREGLHYMRST